MYIISFNNTSAFVGPHIFVEEHFVVSKPTVYSRRTGRTDIRLSLPMGECSALESQHLPAAFKTRDGPSSRVFILYWLKTEQLRSCCKSYRGLFSRLFFYKRQQLTAFCPTEDCTDTVAAVGLPSARPQTWRVAPTWRRQPSTCHLAKHTHPFRMQAPFSPRIFRSTRMGLQEPCDLFTRTAHFNSYKLLWRSLVLKQLAAAVQHIGIPCTERLASNTSAVLTATSHSSQLHTALDTHHLRRTCIFLVGKFFGRCGSDCRNFYTRRMRITMLRPVHS